MMLKANEAYPRLPETEGGDFTPMHLALYRHVMVQGLTESNSSRSGSGRY